MEESVSVEAVFSCGRMQPRRFRWRQTVFPVEQIYLVHVSRRGRDRLYHFSLGSGRMIYELTFNNQSLAWRLVGFYEADSSC